MHETARRGLVRLLIGVGVLVGLVVLVLVAVRGCRSDADVVSAAVDDARDALVDRNREEFLAFFADDVRYRGKSARKELERDLDRWLEFRVGRVTFLERDVTVTDGRTATIRLRCDVGNILQSYQHVDVVLAAEKQDGAWKVTSFDWK